MDVVSRRARLMRRAAAGLGVTLLCASLGGCFSVLHAAQRVVSPEDMQTPTAEPQPRVASTVPPEAPLVTIAPDTTVAEGAIRTPDRAFDGRVKVVSTVTGGYSLTITNYRGPAGHPILATLSSSEVAADSTCDRRPDTGLVLPALGSVGHRSTATFTLAESSSEFIRNDPTFLTNVLFLDPQKNSPGCLSAIAANARLTWSMPDMNPGFHILDTGETGGARGATNSNFQQLIDYTVAPGDVFNEIAARFSITTLDLDWLNPDRISGQDAQLGEVLNLAPYLR